MKELTRIQNGTPVRRTFSDEEYASRLEKLRELMSMRNLDAVFFSSIHNINYYSDFIYCSFGRPYGLFVTHEESTTISANIDGGQPWRRTFGGENLVYTDWKSDNFFRALRSLCPRGKIRLGVESDHLTMERSDKLRAFLPEIEPTDVSGWVMKLRMVKSDEEIAHIEQAAAVADLGGAACARAVGEGVPEHEVALASTGAMVREIARRFPDSELMDTWTWFQSGPNTDGAHNPVTTRRIRKGDVLSLNCFPMISGYYVALERTLFFDHCDEASRKIWEVNCEVHRAGLELLRPGARCCEVAETLNEIYRERGLLEYRTFGYGHSFGVLSHYYGREAGLELREDIQTVLQPGMVVSMEPMLMIPEGKPGAGGYREHDILVITPEGNRNITGFPFGPEHNVI